METIASTRARVRTTIELTPTAQDLRPLCPQCGGKRVELSTHVGVVFDVVGDADTADDLEVIAQHLDDADWSDDTGVRCPACGWRGTVAALART